MALELFKALEGHEAVVAVVVAFLVTAFMIVTGRKGMAVNPSIKKSEPKVVDSFTLTDLEDLVKKDKNGTVALCRCWRSKNFPLCDGTHNAFNKECGENVGPCLIKKK